MFFFIIFLCEIEKENFYISHMKLFFLFYFFIYLFTCFASSQVINTVEKNSVDLKKTKNGSPEEKKLGDLGNKFPI